MNVSRVSDVVLEICDATAVIAAFPYVELALKAKREASLDVLHRLFQRNIRGGSQQEMSVVGHDDERVQFQATLISLVLEDVEEEACILLDLKEASAGRGDGGDEVGAEFLRGERHGRKARG